MRKCSDHGLLLQQNVRNKDLKLSKKKKKVTKRVTTPYYTFSDLVNKREKKNMRFEALLNIAFYVEAEFQEKLRAHKG